MIGGVHYPFDRLSSQHKCKVCGKPIKERLVVQKQIPPSLCYRHWKEARSASAVKAASGGDG